jgi:hypothetical protein
MTILASPCLEKVRLALEEGDLTAVITTLESPAGLDPLPAAPARS